MQRTDFRCLHRMRVRWIEVDSQKIVSSPHYLMYVQSAILDYWRALALPYESGVALLGGELVMRKCTLEYHASARLDDVLEVGLRCVRVGNSSVQLEAGIFRGEQLLVSAEIIAVFIDLAAHSSRPVPVGLRTLLESFEAGHHMAEVRTGDWQQLGDDALALRTAVFVQEQGIAPELELDSQDLHCVHAVVYNRLGQAIATGRLLPAQDGIGRIGRMAVHQALRGAHWGQELLQTLLEAARSRGDVCVELHAQCTAVPFYLRAGFVPRGEPYEEAGITHITMERPLRGTALGADDLTAIV
ncbi:MAG: GNAT family N-acetyltransferase [Burkholderiaceae bacterium]|nr:GNAT family N-acetyltransferase [Burkholderiaceae bacterium]